MAKWVNQLAICDDLNEDASSRLTFELLVELLGKNQEMWRNRRRYVTGSEL